MNMENKDKQKDQIIKEQRITPEKKNNKTQIKTNYASHQISKYDIS